MKTLIMLCCAVIALLQPLQARNYYLSSSSGSDANAGTSSNAPWQTLTKLAAQTLAPGDTVFFKRGDIFRGMLTVNNAGTALAPIVFAAFGTGANPILSGAEPVRTWTQNGANYEASISQNVQNFFINDKEQVIARFPNERQYLFLDSATKRTLTDRDLARVSSNIILNSKLCIHTAQWCWELESVGSFSGTTISYADSSELDALNGFGYFLYDNINHLDTAKEWHYNSTSKILTYRPANGIHPSSVNAEASVYASGLELGAMAQNIIIQDITFEKQYSGGVTLHTNSRNITISRCGFYRQLLYGVELRGNQNTIENCTFAEVDGLAVGKNSGRGDVVHHCTFRNIGQFRNRGVGRQYNHSAIHLGFTDSNYVHHNTVDSAGYCGISADGRYNVIERNIVRNAMLLNNDGAALKSFGGQAQFNTFRNNFVEYSDGNTEGTRNGDFLTPGIYFDFQVSNCVVHENTIYNHTKKGIFQNAGNRNNTITNNIVFGSDYCLDLNGTQAQRDPISGMTVKNNVFIAAHAASYLVKQSDFTSMFQHGTIDSNVYIHPYSASRFALRYAGNQPSDLTSAAWQSTGNDRASRINTLSWGTGANPLRLVMNQTDNVMIVPLGDTLFLDMSGNRVCGSVALQPYTSKVLVKTAELCTMITSVKMSESGFSDGIFAYPSIATDLLTIQSRTEGEYLHSLRTFDAKGLPQNVEMSGLEGSILTLNVSTLAQGMYVVQISTSTGKRYTARFIKM